MTAVDDLDLDDEDELTPSASPASAPASEASAPAPAPSSPPSSAMSIEDARRLLAERHNATLDADDPILMLVTLHQGFTGDLERLIETARTSLLTSVEDTARQTREAVGEALAVIKDEVVNASLTHTLAKVAHEAAQVEAALLSIRRVRKSMAILTAVNGGLIGLLVVVVFF